MNLKWKAVTSGAFLILSAVLFGFMSGGFLGSRVFGGSGMGWDRLADALGGMMVGILVSTVASVFLLLHLDTRKRWIAGALFIAGALLALILLRVIPLAPMT